MIKDVHYQYQDTMMVQRSVGAEQCFERVPVVSVLQVGFDELEKFALSNPEPAASLGSGRQELAEIYLDMALK